MCQPCHPGGGWGISCCLRTVWAQKSVFESWRWGAPPANSPLLSWAVMVVPRTHILTRKWVRRTKAFSGRHRGMNWRSGSTGIVGTRDSFVDVEAGRRTLKGDGSTLRVLGYLSHLRFILCKTEPLSPPHTQPMAYLPPLGDSLGVVLGSSLSHCL